MLGKSDGFLIFALGLLLMLASGEPASAGSSQDSDTLRHLESARPSDEELDLAGRLQVSEAVFRSARTRDALTAVSGPEIEALRGAITSFEARHGRERLDATRADQLIGLENALIDALALGDGDYADDAEDFYYALVAIAEMDAGVEALDLYNSGRRAAAISALIEAREPDFRTYAPRDRQASYWRFRARVLPLIIDAYYHQDVSLDYVVSQHYAVAQVSPPDALQDFWHSLLPVYEAVGETNSDRARQAAISGFQYLADWYVQYHSRFGRPPDIDRYSSNEPRDVLRLWSRAGQHEWRGEPVEALALYDEIETVLEPRAGERYGWAEFWIGQPDSETVLIYQAGVAARASMDLARTHFVSGNILKDLGDGTAALNRYREGLSILRSINFDAGVFEYARQGTGLSDYRHAMVAGLIHIGELHAVRGEHAEAVAMYREARGLCADLVSRSEDRITIRFCAAPVLRLAQMPESELSWSDVLAELEPISSEIGLNDADLRWLHRLASAYPTGESR